MFGSKNWIVQFRFKKKSQNPFCDLPKSFKNYVFL